MQTSADRRPNGQIARSAVSAVTNAHSAAYNGSMEQLMNWQTLSTYGGAVLATATVTQFLKEFGVLKRVPTRLLSYGIALLLLLLSTQFTIGLTWANALTCVVNAAMVSLAGNGAYDAVVYTKNCIDCGKQGNPPSCNKTE